MNNNSLFVELEKLLRMESAYCTEDGVLLKNAIVEAALALRPELIAKLLTHDGLKRNFFTEVEGVLVFDKVKFQKFVMNKRFLPDSYTSFKNKVGLTNEDGDFLSESREVVLSWPYKDCVLEGGQTKEDAKRNEVFWNEILAPDEINRLTEPKVLTNFKRYDKDGEHEVDSVSMDDNLIIKGNNLLALHSLKRKYAGRVKLIYIDPPYNTGSDSFGYNDNFNHSTWLTFMRNRLEVARKLLRKDGCIFVQIDHHELAYVSILLDEIFGKENKVQIISVKTASASGFKSINPGPIDVTEYILFYTNEKSSFDFRKNYVPMGYNKNYNKYLEKNNSENTDDWKFISIKEKVLGEINKSEKDLKKQFGDNYSIVLEQMVAKYAYNNADKIISIRDLHKPTEKVKELQKLSKITKNKIFSYTKSDGSKTYIVNGGAIAFYSSKMHLIDGEICITELLSDFWSHISWAGIAKEGNITFKNAKKPEKLIKQILEIGTEENEIVLDFFWGSGTTAAVAHKMKRKYISIEQMDYQMSLIASRINNVIMGDTTGISKSVNWQGGGSFVYCKLAKANQQFADDIEHASSSEELATIWEQMQETGFLSWKVNPKEIDTNAEDFTTLTIEDQKRFLIECLDKNLLYVPYSEIDNAEYGISENDKKINNQFYQTK